VDWDLRPADHCGRSQGRGGGLRRVLERPYEPERLGPLSPEETAAYRQVQEEVSLFLRSLARAPEIAAGFLKSVTERMGITTAALAQGLAGAVPLAQAGTLGAEPQFTRGHRVDLLRDALAPLHGALPPKQVDRLAQALSLVFGVEVLIVLKDIWGLDGDQTRAVAQWAAAMLVRGAAGEFGGEH
jgi:hypothetical protein